MKYACTSMDDLSKQGASCKFKDNIYPWLVKFKLEMIISLIIVSNIPMNDKYYRFPDLYIKVTHFY